MYIPSEIAMADKQGHALATWECIKIRPSTHSIYGAKCLNHRPIVAEVHSCIKGARQLQAHCSMSKAHVKPKRFGKFT